MYKNKFRNTNSCHVYFNSIYLLPLIVVLIFTGCSKKQGSYTLQSPDGKMAISVYTDSTGRLMYHVTNTGKPVIGDAALGITVVAASIFIVEPSAL